MTQTLTLRQIASMIRNYVDTKTNYQHVMVRVNKDFIVVDNLPLEINAAFLVKTVCQVPVESVSHSICKPILK